MKTNLVGNVKLIITIIATFAILTIKIISSIYNDKYINVIFITLIIIGSIVEYYNFKKSCQKN